MTPTHILAVEVLETPPPSDNGDNIVGLKWRETRMYGGKKVDMTNTVISVTRGQQHSDEICATYSVCYDGNTWETQQANQTGSFSIVPVESLENNKKQQRPCYRIIMTVNYVADGWMGLWMKLCRCCVERYGVQYMTTELEDYAAEAVRRETQQKQKERHRHQQTFSSSSS